MTHRIITTHDLNTSNNGLENLGARPGMYVALWLSDDEQASLGMGVGPTPDSAEAYGWSEYIANLSEDGKRRGRMITYLVVDSDLSADDPHFEVFRIELSNESIGNTNPLSWRQYGDLVAGRRKAYMAFCRVPMRTDPGCLNRGLRVVEAKTGRIFRCAYSDDDSDSTMTPSFPAEYA